MSSRAFVEMESLWTVLNLFVNFYLKVSRNSVRHTIINNVQKKGFHQILIELYSIMPPRTSVEMKNLWTVFYLKVNNIKIQ